MLLEAAHYMGRALKIFPGRGGYFVLVQLVSIAAIFYGLEVWLRWTFQERPVPTSERSWIYYPLGPDIAGKTLVNDQLEYSTTMSYNRMGFRDHELPSHKSVGVRRIVYIGDSFVEGMGVAEQKRFSNLVEKELVHRGATFSTVNLGQCATDPIQYLNNLANLGLSLEPDVVVFGLYMGNDFQEAAKYPVKTEWKEQRRVSVPESSANDFAALGYVRLLVKQVFGGEKSLVRRSTSQIFLERLYKRPVNRNMIREYSGLSDADMDAAMVGIDKSLVLASEEGLLNPGSLIDAIKRSKRKTEPLLYYSNEDFEAVSSVIVECRRLCLKKQSAFIVLLIPDISQVTPRSFLETCKRWGYEGMPRRLNQLPELSNRMIKLLQQQNIDFIDLTPALSSLGAKGYYPLDRHLTESGHRCIADELLRCNVIKTLK